MHQLFADWYRQVDLNISADSLNVRWSCVEAAIKKLDIDNILQLTRVCFSLPKPVDRTASNDGATIALAYKEADPSFPMKGNDNLLRVLYGVTLAHAIESRHSLATFAALAVTSARCCALTPAPAIEELTAIAEQHLTQQGKERRNKLLEDSIVAPKFGKLELVTPGAIDVQDPPQNNWPALQQNIQSLRPWITQVNAAIEGLISATNKTRADITAAFKANADRAALENRIQVLKEECNVLWWLFGEYSDAVQRAWTSGAAVDFCVIHGRELAELMAFYEPTPNVESFLAKALSRSALASEPLTARQVLEGGSSDWRTDLAQSVRDEVKRSLGVTPLHTGLVEHVDSSSRWVERVSELTALKPEHQLSPVQWALQAFREALVLSWMESARG